MSKRKVTPENSSNRNVDIQQSKYSTYKNEAIKRTPEIIESVCKQNNLDKYSAKSLINTDFKDYKYCESSDDLSEIELKIKDQLLQSRRKERHEILDSFKVLPRRNLVKTLNMLEENSKIKTSAAHKRNSILKKKCFKNISKLISTFEAQEAKHLWRSPTYLMKSIRTSILNRNWANLTTALLFLLNFQRKGDRKYILYCKQAALLNFMYNPTSLSLNIIEEFKEMFNLK